MAKSKFGDWARRQERRASLRMKKKKGIGKRFPEDMTFPFVTSSLLFKWVLWEGANGSYDPECNNNESCWGLEQELLTPIIHLAFSQRYAFPKYYFTFSLSSATYLDMDPLNILSNYSALFLPHQPEQEVHLLGWLICRGQGFSSDLPSVLYSHNFSRSDLLEQTTYWEETRLYSW